MNTENNDDNFGHLVLMYIRARTLYFIDSLASHPINYGGNIFKFYSNFNNHKRIVFTYPIQSPISNVCGAYAIIFALFMCKNKSLICIKSLFSKSCKNKNDIAVQKLLYKMSGFRFM